VIVAERVLYGDVLLIINFSMDFLALYITATILHLKRSNIRMTAAAVIGAVYSLLSVMSTHSTFTSALISVAVSVLLCFTAYGKHKKTYFLKIAIVFYCVNFALGGGITAICNLLNIWKNTKNIHINGTFDVLYGDIPFGLLALLAIVCGIISVFSGRLAAKNKKTEETEFTITANGSTVKLNGLIDSGNLLTDPLSGRPVIVVCYDSVRSLLPTELLRFIKTKDPALLNLENLPPKTRLIPVCTVGKNSLLFAFLPDNILLEGRQVDAFIAIDTNTASYGGNNAVIPAVLTE